LEGLKLDVENGTYRYKSVLFALDGDYAASFGEAERSTCQGFKEPTLLYGYICALRPEQRAARIQIHTRTLRDERELWAKDQIDRTMGKVLSRIASAEMLLEAGGLEASIERQLDDHLAAPSVLIQAVA
jgi:hypothetical protein